MSAVAFTVPGNVRGWARARLGRLPNGQPKHFMDAKTRSYEGSVKLFGSAAMQGRAPFDEPVTMTLVARQIPPASVSKVKRAAMLSGAIRPRNKPDASNIAKGIEDALNGIAYRDDALIADLRVSKVYAPEAGVDVTIEPIGGAR